MLQDLLNLENDREFHKQIRTLTIPELEQLIKLFDKQIRRSDHEARHKIGACFGQRQYLLNERFDCSPENLEHLRNVANLIKKNTEILRKKGDELYAQMSKIWHEKKNEPFSDFYVKLSLRIHFNCEEDSILHLPDDNSGSDYVKMSEFLDDYHCDRANNLIFWNDLHYDPENNTEQKSFLGDILANAYDLDYDGKDNHLLWEYLGRRHPKLLDIKITQEFHHLIDHTKYALQDIIRINDVWGDVKVAWQHITRQDGVTY